MNREKAEETTQEAGAQRQRLEEVHQRIAACLNQLALPLSELGDLPDAVQELRAITESLRSQHEAVEDEAEGRSFDSDRLFLIGELAASVAHDFNNPLQIVLMLVHDLARSGNRTDAQSDALTAIESEIEHCRGIITNLIDFVRPYDAEMTSVSIKRVIRDSVKLIQTYLQKEKINIEMDIPPALPEIRADAVQLKQVLIHLFLNAAQAMPNGGTLSVRATVTPAPSTDDIVEQAPIGEELTVAISYSGTGIASDEPMERGRRKLGLSTCERIIKAHRGRMKTENWPSQGMTFHLPVATR